MPEGEAVGVVIQAASVPGALAVQVLEATVAARGRLLQTELTESLTEGLVAEGAAGRELLGLVQAE